MWQRWHLYGFGSSAIVASIGGPVKTVSTVGLDK